MRPRLVRGRSALGHNLGVVADLTVVATPGYFATMGAEHLLLRRREVRRGAPVGSSPADYTKPDTLASLSMGVGSLVAPLVLAKVLEPFVPGKGRFGKVLVRTAVGAAAVTTVADVVVRRARRRGRNSRAVEAAEQVASVGGVVAVASGGLAITTAWSSLTRIDRLWKRRFVRDLGTGPLALGAAIVGWDFIYYWNHRFMHESRYMWAVHVVHHSSEHYNLSTALRQPVADALGHVRAVRTAVGCSAYGRSS